MKKILLIILVFCSHPVLAQNGSGKDSTAFLDSIMNEMDDILDHMVGSKSILSVSAGAGTGFFNFKGTSATQPKAEKKLLFSPRVSYLHKSGLGISATGYAVSEQAGLNPYQFSISPSYDYIKRGKWSTGIAFSRYFTKEGLSFYTTPIQNEMYAYFNYKKTWLQPGIALGYGWGNRTQYEERKPDLLRLRRLRDPALITMRTDESVSDVSLLLSLRHDFDWNHIFTKHDLLTITPVALLSSGTRNFGFNTSYQGSTKILNNFLPGNQNIKESSVFGAHSISFVMRADYSVGVFFFQSQMLLDYYLQDAGNRFNNAFSVIAGVNF